MNKCGHELLQLSVFRKKNATGGTDQERDKSSTSVECKSASTGTFGSELKDSPFAGATKKVLRVSVASLVGILIPILASFLEAI